MTRLSLLVIYDIDFIHINIYNLLIKTYLSLIFIKYFINEYRVKIKFLEQKYFAKEIKGLEICTVGLELESGRTCTSCKSLGQPGFYSLTWAHKVRFPRGEVSSNPKKKNYCIKKLFLNILG
jgi:hypothetical protein